MSNDHPWADFDAWADHAGDSPLYQFLARRVADDPEIAALASEIANPAPQNLLFASVQFLLSGDDPLAEFFASRTTTPSPADESWEPFRRFVISHRDAILEIGHTRRTQTNEVGRVAAMLPMLTSEADRLGEPVHLVEVGASAGLNLCVDRFRYDIAGTILGQSDLTLRVESKGGIEVPRRPPYVQRRVGIDLSPIDIDDPDDVRWLEALVWPEQHERRRRLRAALRIRRTVQVEMIAGDASVSIGPVLDGLPTGGPAIVFHSFAWNQFDADARSRFDAAMERAAARRSLSRVGFEYWGDGGEWPQIRIGLTSDSARPVAEAHPHGDWVRGL